MAPTKSETITFRLEGDALRDLDRIVRELTARAVGVEVTRSAAAREALALGLAALKQKLEIVDIVLPGTPEWDEMEKEEKAAALLAPKPKAGKPRRKP